MVAELAQATLDAPPLLPLQTTGSPAVGATAASLAVRRQQQDTGLWRAAELTNPEREQVRHAGPAWHAGGPLRH